MLDSCGQKCRLASSANDGRALKLSVRGRSSVTAARGDIPPVRRVLSDTLCPRDFLVTPPLPVHFPVHPRTLLMLAPPGDTSNLVICVLHLLVVQYPSTLFLGCLEQEARAGGCWKLCSTSCSNITSACIHHTYGEKLNREHGGCGRIPGARSVFSARGFGARGAWEHLGPTKNHPLSLSHQQACNHKPMSLTFSDLI